MDKIETPPSAVTTTQPSELELTATEPEEIRTCNENLIQWCKQKIQQLTADHEELEQSYKHAIAQKWAYLTLKRHADLCARRIEFYQKLQSALEHGFVIIPNFPVTVFAIRTDRTKPLKLMTTWHWNKHEQGTETLPAGEGEYKNPFPAVYERDITTAEERAKGKSRKQYWAENYNALEFPVNMAKPRIMEAATRSMALKLFDDFAILPENRREKGDPIIVARLKDPRSTKYALRFVTFMVAWHLDTKTL